MLKTPEIIHPSPGNQSRRSDTVSAVFNLIATVVGGGTLSLPYAFSQASVAKVAFGPTGGYATTLILLCMTLFVLLAYMILVRDIWSGLIGLLVGWFTENEAGEVIFTPEESNWVLVGCLIATLPACLAKSLHALRHMCYVGFFSALVLTVAIGYRCFEYNTEHPEARKQAVAFTSNASQILGAFPIMSLAFMCQFNILSVHASLVNPTRERLKGIIHSSLGAGGSIYLALGFLGYFYAYGNTQDDILLNFAPSDKVVVWGRLGLGITMLVAIPMLLLPCRDAFEELASQLYEVVTAKFSARKTTPLISGNGASSSRGNYSSLNGELGATGSFDTSSMDANVAAALRRVMKAARHFMTTVGLMIFCLFFAVSIPGVALVWSICGSSVGFFVSFGLPALFYLKIRAKKAFNIRKLAAWVMLIVTCFASVLCTYNAIATAASKQ
ncbi:transmembrane amino acid transporter protein-domain-containing protein [Tribonema minus]|uniref:Transmembrane amino acid transporter protein-domain-containing protein n=1 Tax=Tribonema minus TaxID=303371 RepID=A0A835YKB4_9STRA|nr:transmembrane amino acid transporter protein-domain-containing protein [Tribonema minus]